MLQLRWPTFDLQQTKVDGLLPAKSASLRTMSLRLEELSAVYGAVSHEEAIAIANLGAACYTAAKDQLYEAWAATQDDTEREDLWRKEGEAAAVERLRGQLAERQALKERVAFLEAKMESELDRRLEEMVSVRMKEAEIVKREEMLVLRGQVIELQGASKMMAMLEQAHRSMTAEIEKLREENASLKEATATKSSNTIGRIGEETVKVMLESYISSSMFSEIEVFDKTKIKHSGDFHVHIMGKHGKMVRIMIDVKKYSKPVDNIEIQKLYSDLDACDVDVGLMLSLDSSICTKKPFQLTKTKGNKLCMFLTFEKLDDEIRKEILCWAIRALVGVVATQDQSKQDVMVTEIQQFLVDMLRAVDKFDSLVKSIKGVYDMSRELRDEILGRITTFKTTCGMEAIDTIIETSAAVSASDLEMRCKAKNMNGTECKSRRVAKGIYCKRHTQQEARRATVLEDSTEDCDVIVHE